MAAGTPPPELQTVQDPIMAAGPPPPPESSPSTATPPPPSSSGPPPPPESSPSTATPPPPPPSSSAPSPPPESSPSTATPPPPPPSSSGPSPPPESSPSTATPPPPPPSSSEHTEKWGTHVMGQPANPNDHPDNQKAASWNAAEHQQFHHQQSPYLLYSPVDKPTTNPLEPVIHFFNSWTTKADTISRNIWHNLKTGSSVTGAAWGKVNLTAKAITEGGFESMFKQIFSPFDPNEKLKKTFACYFSTSTGPVAGTIYLSTARIAFCSDRPLSFTAPSGQETWGYYRVVVPLGNVGTVNPVTMREKSSERYIQIVTVDGHDFWFMGFVNYEKASMHLMNSLSEFNASVAPAAAV